MFGLPEFVIEADGRCVGWDESGRVQGGTSASGVAHSVRLRETILRAYSPLKTVNMTFAS